MFRLLFLIGPLCVMSTPVSHSTDLQGTWEGEVQVGSQKVRTVLHFLEVDGGWAGTVDSPEQEAFGLSLRDVEFANGQLRFSVPDTQAQWSGTLKSSHENQRLLGTWQQQGDELPLDFTRVEVDSLVGSWAGEVNFGGTKLRLVFHVGTRADGSLGASMVSPDQSATAIPVSKVETGEDGAVRFEIAAVGARFEGVRAAEGDPAAGNAIAGKFLQGGVEVPLILSKTGPPPRPRRPQTPQAPFPYHSEEVVYPNDEAKLRLAGTLTRPRGKGPFPAVLLITGSGAQDRDETLFDHKPFLVIADALTRKGIAVLRVDDRGVGKSSGSMATATSADFATDVHAGVDFLSHRDDIDPEGIGLLGHSEGGLIAPMVAAERSDIAFLVLLAGPGTTGERILLRQGALIAEAGGAPPEVVEASRTARAALFAILREEEDLRVARTRMKKELARIVHEAGQETPAAEINAQVAALATPWFRYFLDYDPASALREVACPVLALNGALDLQVPAGENLAAIRAALEEAGNDDITTLELDGLNHLFQQCTTGSPSEYAEIEQTFSEEVLQRIADWIGARMLGGS